MSNKDYIAWLGCLAGKGRLLLLGSIVLKWLEDAVNEMEIDIAVTASPVEQT